MANELCAFGRGSQENDAVTETETQAGKEVNGNPTSRRRSSRSRYDCENYMRQARKVWAAPTDGIGVVTNSRCQCEGPRVGH
ncbi:uncharacterized protein ARMOST_20809 [Armillaria ostoyae]|uniref:Uncharacterized protein n=1 Tax=Armillaria ostoyae TaxID=47428 RepID=A0A284S8B1_ARMOS|nr:uncharacterized protein ARMOST_20809 [Armillaria ostoyae]